MKRRDFVRHLELHHCRLEREGAKHSVYKNLRTGINATVPRHREIWPRMTDAICKQLDIPAPRKK